MPIPSFGRPLFCLALAASAQPAFGILECATPEGKFMNLSNGETTRGFTGRIICKEKDDGLIQREEKYVNGAQTWERFYEKNKPVRERFVNAQGNTHGLAKEFWPSGKVKSESNYVNGDRRGLTKKFFESGKVESIGFYVERGKKTELTYNEDGTLSEISCSSGTFSKEDRQLCGYSGKPGVVTLYSPQGKAYRQLTFDQGKVVETKQLDDSGKVEKTEKFATKQSDGVRIEKFPDGTNKTETRYDARGMLNGLQREFDESGQLTREAVFKGGFMEKEQLFYLNGQAKRLTEKTKQGEKVSVKSVAYWDSGKVQRQGQFDEVREQRDFGWGAFWRYDDLREQGEFRSYYENGALESVENYLDGKPEGVSRYYYKDGKTLQREVTYTKGVMSRLREFKKTGARIKDDAYFKDGSRKSLKK